MFGAIVGWATWLVALVIVTVLCGWGIHSVIAAFLAWLSGVVGVMLIFIIEYVELKNWNGN